MLARESSGIELSGRTEFCRYHAGKDQRITPLLDYSILRRSILRPFLVTELWSDWLLVQVWQFVPGSGLPCSAEIPSG